MIEHSVRLTGPAGTFQATSFTEWIGHLVDVTGLDPALHHVLRKVENTEDGTSSTLTLATVRDDGPDLAAAMSVRVGTPTCPVRAFVGGTQVAAAQMEAPLQLGAPVRIGDQHYTVQAISYPARQADGTTTGDDYQHADLTATDATPFDVRTLGGAPAALAGLFGGA